MASNEDEMVREINGILGRAKRWKLDHEMILARVFAEHMNSNEKCDECHLYGITFAEKINKLMDDGKT